MTELNGGTKFTVTKKDGETAEVFVRQLPVSEYPKFLAVQDNESAIVALVCGVKAEFCDSVAYESHEALIAKIEELNLDFFSRWVQRHLARQEKLIPGLTAKRLAAGQSASLSS